MDKRRVICLLLIIVWGLLVPGAVWGAAGDLLWGKQFTFLPQFDTININSTALSSMSYIISGYARNNDGTGVSLGFIKAYDVATGNIKWEKTLTLGDVANSFDSIAINGDIALVRGIYRSGSPTPTLLKSFIRAYNANTGQLLWEVLRDFESSPTIAPVTYSTLTANNKVFAFFAAADTSGILNYGTFFVRAYQVRNITTAIMLLLE